jgi:predicted cytidylate kinase
MIITLGGHPLSGKGTVGRLLAAQLSYTYWNGGERMRAEAAKRGMSLSAFNEFMRAHPEIDRALDAEQKEAATKPNSVVDGRVAYYVAPHSYKIFLDVNPNEAARRLMLAHRAQEQVVNEADALVEITQRREQETKRFLAVYGTDPHDKANFDLAIDTTALTPEQVVEKILAALPK